MAPEKSYTLEDFTTYARKNFSTAFDLVADPLAYTFNCGHFRTMDGEVKEGELLKVAYRNGHCAEAPLWAWFNEGNLEYLKGHSSSFMTSSRSRYCQISEYMIVPFCFLAKRTRLNSTVAEFEVGVTFKKRLDLLVKFVFLSTGQISQITNEDRMDLLMEFEDLCMHIQLAQETERQESIEKRESEVQPWAQACLEQEIPKTKETGDTTVRSEDVQSKHPEGDAPETASMAVRNSKRVAIDMSGESAETAVHKCPRIAGPNHSNRLESAKLTQADRPSSQVQSILETLVQQCKAELTRESTTREEASQADIVQLQAELVKQTKKIEEAEKRYEIAESSRISSLGEQQDVIAGLRNEVRDWKKKYEKLNKKVQIFMSDD